MIQKVFFKPTTEWVHPNNFPDLSKYDEIAIDLETKDPELKKMGPGMFRGVGEIVGFAVAVKDVVEQLADAPPYSTTSTISPAVAPEARTTDVPFVAVKSALFNLAPFMNTRMFPTV